MKFDIKSLLTGTTLFVASTTGIMAEPPKGLKLIHDFSYTEEGKEFYEKERQIF